MLIGRPDYMICLPKRGLHKQTRTSEEVEVNIQAEIAQITPATLQNVMQNVIKSANACMNFNGGYLILIIFHTYCKKCS